MEKRIQKILDSHTTKNHAYHMLNKCILKRFSGYRVVGYSMMVTDNLSEIKDVGDRIIILAIFFFRNIRHQHRN